MASRRFLPTFSSPPERKAAVDRRHSAGPTYAFQGTPYMPITDMELDRVIRDSWERDVWVYRAVHARATNAAGIDVVIRDGRGKKAKPIEGHPLAELLNGQANPYEPAFDFRYRLHTLLDLSVKKGCFVEVTEGRGGLVSRVDILNPMHTWPLPHADTFVSGFQMRLPSGEVFDELPPYQRGSGGVLWFKRPHPTDPYSSSSWIQAAGLSIDLDYWARRYNLNFLFNDGRPGGVLAVHSSGDDDDGGLDPEEAAALQARMSGGPGAAGRISILEAEHLEYIDLSQSPRDAQYVEGRQITQREILVAAGTPLSVIGDASGRTYDNADAEEETFWKKEMVPELKRTANRWEELTTGGLQNTKEVVDFDWDSIECLQRERRRVEAAAGADLDRAAISIDEYREITGREPMNIAGTRVLWQLQGKAPIGDPADVTALLTQGQAAPGAAPAPGAGPPVAGGAPGDAAAADAAAAGPPGAPGPNDQGVVDPLNEQGYAIKALLTVPKALAATRRREHSELIDKWSGATADEIRGLLSRQQAVVLSRLRGTKARHHTRHWEYKGQAPAEFKALDPAYIVERGKWIKEAVAALKDVVLAAFGAAGDATATSVGADGFDPAQAAAEVVARTVRVIAEGLDARAGQLQEIITEAEAAGASIDDIAQKVTDAYLSADTWANATSRAVVGAMNAASLIAATNAGALAKRWLATDDERTRPTHREAEGQVVGIGENFQVGAAELAFPHDPTGPPEETINCRCTMLYQLGAYDPAADVAAHMKDGEWKAFGHIHGVNIVFDPRKHPRDHRGRFLDVPDVTLPSGAVGTAVATDKHGSVIVSLHAGGTMTLPATDLQIHVSNPASQLEVVRAITRADLSNPATPRSREVTPTAFQQIAAKGRVLLGGLRERSSPPTGLHEHWTAIVASAWESVQSPWGGLTVDAHTGTALIGNEDKYALSVKPANVSTVSIPIGSTRAEFDQAMATARTQFAGELANQQHYLGVFRDEDNNRIDIDPVLVVDSIAAAESVGAYTHAVGGAYHFADGNGYWPPHIGAAHGDGQGLQGSGSVALPGGSGPAGVPGTAARAAPGLSPAQTQGLTDASPIVATEVYASERPVRAVAQPLTLPAAGELARRVLTDAGFPQGSQAEAIDHPAGYGHSSVAWDTGTTPAIPLVALGGGMHDELTVLHEAAHIIRNGPSFAGKQGDAKTAHDPQWFATYRDLVDTYGSPDMAQRFDRVFSGSQWPGSTPLNAPDGGPAKKKPAAEHHKWTTSEGWVVTEDNGTWSIYIGPGRVLYVGPPEGALAILEKRPGGGALNEPSMLRDAASLPGYLAGYARTAIHPGDMNPVFRSPAETPSRWQLVKLPDGRFGQVASGPDHNGMVDVIGVAGTPLVRANLFELKPAGPPPYRTNFYRGAERHVTDSQGHRHWGAAGGAGVLIRNVGQDGQTRYLLQLRSPSVQHGGTWSTPGGAMHIGETPAAAGVREATEEIGALPDGIKPGPVFTDDHGGWAYHTIVLDSPTAFDTTPNDHEGLLTWWFTDAQIASLPLHPSFKESWPALSAQLINPDKQDKPPHANHPDAVPFTETTWADYLPDEAAAVAAVQALPPRHSSNPALNDPTNPIVPLFDSSIPKGEAVPQPRRRPGPLSGTLMGAVLARVGIPFDPTTEPSMKAGSLAAKSGETGDGAKARASIPTIEQLIDKGQWKGFDGPPGQVVLTALIGSRMKVEGSSTGTPAANGKYAIEGKVADVSSTFVTLHLDDGTYAGVTLAGITKAEVHTGMNAETAQKEWKRLYNNARFRIRDARLKAAKKAAGEVTKDKAAGTPGIVTQHDLAAEHGAALDGLIAGLSAEVLTDVGGGGKPQALYSLTPEQLASLTAAGKYPGPGSVSPYERWQDKAASLADGDRIPVVGLVIQGRVVEHGTVFKFGQAEVTGSPVDAGVNYPPILIEHQPGDDLAAVEADAVTVAQRWSRAVEKVPAGLRASVTGFAWLKGQSPADAHWAAVYNIPNFTSSATGGDGTITFWNVPPSVGTIAHEFGHTLDRSAPSTIPGSSLTDDGGPGHSPLPSGYNPADPGTSQLAMTPSFHYSSWTQVRKDDEWTQRSWQQLFKAADDNGLPTSLTEVRKAPGDHSILIGESDGTSSFAPTDYGRVSVGEDFAESVRLYLKDQRVGKLGYLTPTDSTAGVNIRFADLWPERAAYLSHVFGQEPVKNTAWQQHQAQSLAESLTALGLDADGTDAEWPDDIDMANQYVIPRDLVTATRMAAADKLIAALKVEKEKEAAAEKALAAKQKAAKEADDKATAWATAAAQSWEAQLAEAAKITAIPLDKTALKKIAKRKAWIKWNAKQSKQVVVASTGDNGAIYTAEDLRVKDAKGKIVLPPGGKVNVQFNVKGQQPGFSLYRGKPVTGGVKATENTITGEVEKRPWVEFINLDYFDPTAGPDSHWVPAVEPRVFLDQIAPGSLVRVDKVGVSEADAQKIANAYESKALTELGPTGLEKLFKQLTTPGGVAVAPKVDGLSEKQVADILIQGRLVYEDALKPQDIKVDDILSTGLEIGDPVGAFENEVVGGQFDMELSPGTGAITTTGYQSSADLGTSLTNVTVHEAHLGESGTVVMLTVSTPQSIEDGTGQFVVNSSGITKMTPLDAPPPTPAEAAAARQAYVISAIKAALLGPPKGEAGDSNAPSTEVFSSKARKDASTWLHKNDHTVHPLAKSQGSSESQAKANIAAELASRLNNEQDWGLFKQARAAVGGITTGDYFTSVPTSLPAFADITTEQRHEYLAAEVANRISGWASSSGDSNPWSIAMQRAIHEEFDSGGQWNPHGMNLDTAMGGYSNSGGPSLDSTWGNGVGAFYRRFVRVMYDNTQAQLAADGVTEVSLYRGMQGAGGHQWSTIGSHPVTDLMPANSWSSAENVAGNFGGGNYTGSGARMLVGTFPASRLLGSARTGFGCWGEWEFVVLNGPGNITVYSGGSNLIPSGKESGY